MAKPIIEESYLTGSLDRITKSNCFLYEISIYRKYSDRTECLGSKFFKSNVPLKFKKRSIRIKNKDFTLEKYITWLEAPSDYIEKNNLPLYIQKNGKNKRKS